VSRERATALAALVAGFGALAGLVVAGTLNGLDGYALAHWMPGFRPSSSSGLDLRGLWRPFTLSDNWWTKLLGLWTYPASVLVSGLVFAAAFVALRRRGAERAALVWAGAWIAGNALEVVGKELLDRPRLHWHGAAIESFQGSFPSGHTIRSILVAALLLWFFGRRAWAAVLWAALVLPSLVVIEAHTPSDVLGGMCVGLALALVAREAVR
jgi:membrane-associated phospholipid phosphatase